ncbi:hypothetical protein KVV02_000040 [Mortierella alpina]|uniref:Uncharacterized protein n=1 Tax=Mortierella alpina TaxID=64518 RepID=A0A9P8A6J6_MORAP|nr:hypothetical protein KVV02_000040 [Mortierella alpina]
MYPNQTGRATDKENDIAADAGVVRGAAGSHPATLVKQASLLGSRTPGKQQQQQQGLKMNMTKTPTQQGKNTVLGLGSPSAQSVLRAKTNRQQLQPATDESNTAAWNKKSGLARTFSAALENNNTFAPTTPVASESRRRSLTKRGSAKSRLVVHQDEPALPDIKDNLTKSSLGTNNPTQTVRPAARLVRAAPVETATTLLSIERAIGSEDKVVTGSAENKTKRRALMNDEDSVEIEYCPPPVKEQPYEPEDRIDTSVLSNIPPAIAYRFHSMTEFDLGLPDVEPAEFTRPSRYSSPPVESEVSYAKSISLPKTTITADGHFEAVWSDDEEDDHQVHPRGGRSFGIKDLYDESKVQPPFDGFIFNVDAQSEDSLSEDEDDIFGGTKAMALVTSKGVKGESEINNTFGLEDLEDETKVEAPFSDFAFEL